MLLRDMAQRTYVTVEASASLFDLLNCMRTENARVALVVSKTPPQSVSDVLGVITRDNIAVSVEDAVDLFV